LPNAPPDNAHRFRRREPVYHVFGIRGQPGPLFTLNEKHLPRIPRFCSHFGFSSTWVQPLLPFRWMAPAWSILRISAKRVLLATMCNADDNGVNPGIRYDETLDPILLAVHMAPD